MSEPIVVIAHWETAADALPEVLELVAQLGRRSLEEPGCLGYEVLQNDQPDTVVLLERYRDQQALEAHRSSPHYRELLVERILPKLSARRVELLRPRAP